MSRPRLHRVASVVLLAALADVAHAAPDPIAVGSEFPVNTSVVNDQTAPAIAMDDQGNFIVAWATAINPGTGDNDVLVQRYAANGTRIGTPIAGNAFLTGSQTFPAVAMSPDGTEFVVTWQSAGQDGSGNGVYVQHFNADGSKQGGEFAASNVSTGDQNNPAIAMDANGNFAVAWEDPGGKISVHRYFAHSDGAAVHVAITNGFTPSVAMLGDGSFVVAYARSSNIYAQRVNLDGTVLGSEITVAVDCCIPYAQPSVAADAAGNFVVAYQSTDIRTSIAARRFDRNGALISNELAVSPLAGPESQPAVAMAPSGEFAISWTGTDASGTGVFVRRFDATGVARANTYLVNTQTSGNQDAPAIALDPSGNFAVAWESPQDGSGLGVYGQRFHPQSIDVSVDQFDDADPAPVGVPLHYTIVANNLNPVNDDDPDLEIATGLRLNDQLPAGATGVSASGANWTCTFPSGRVACNYGASVLPGGESTPVVITLTPPNAPGTRIGNLAAVTAAQSDPDPSNNREIERTHLACAESHIQFTATTFTVSESGGNALVTVSRSGGACGAASAQVDTANGSATAGLDFTDTSSVVSWADGESGPRTVMVPINNDALDEIDERVALTLSNVSGATPSAPTQTRLVITDDDAPPRINFTSSAQSVTEAPALASVSARLGAISGRDVIVPLTFGGTASNGSDYFPSASTLTIPAGQLQAGTDIEIVGDTVPEPNETIIVGMGVVSGATVGSISTQTITITDDDAAVTPTVGFTAATSSGDETVAKNFAVKLSAASAQTITVPFTLSGTATQGADYAVGKSSPITFTPGTTQVTVAITPVNDALDEPDETVVVTLGAPTNATLSGITVHTRTIVDNDP